MTDNDKMRFASAMTAMYKAFNREPDKDITRLFFECLKHITIEDAEQVISFAMLHEEKFPTMHGIRRYISMIPSKPVPRIENKSYSKYGTTLSETAAKMVSAILDGKLTRDQIIEGMLLFDKQFPNIGWKEQAAELVAYYRREEEITA